MALDVWVGDWNEHGSKLIVSFDPEAYYSFLYPLFEEFEQTYGQMIDLYDGAMFQADALVSVFELIDKAKTFVSSQDEQFDVHMGINLGSYVEPKTEEIFCTVQRNEFLQFIERWRTATHMAQEAGKPLIFYGD